MTASTSTVSLQLYFKNDWFVAQSGKTFTETKGLAAIFYEHPCHVTC